MEALRVTLYCLRLLWVCMDIAIFIPTYLAFMLIMYPFKYIKREMYVSVEGYLFRRVIRCVSHWRSTAGYDIVEYGDDPDDHASDYVLVLANHTSTADVPVLMSQYANRHFLIENVMWIQDSMFRFMPFGWVSMARGDFFVRSGKNLREESLSELRTTLQRTFLRLRRKWLVLFPEGGFLLNRKESSQRYARKNGFPHLEHVTLPRMGCLKQILPSGFTTISDPSTSSSKGSTKHLFTYVADVTIAYDGEGPLNFEDFVLGWVDTNRRVHVHYDFIPTCDIPTEETELRDWLHERWVKKEGMLEEFAKTGFFPKECRLRGVDSHARFNLRETLSDHLFFSFWAIVFTVIGLKSSPWFIVFLLLLPCLRFTKPDLFYDVETGGPRRLMAGCA